MEKGGQSVGAAAPFVDVVSCVELPNETPARDEKPYFRDLWALILFYLHAGVMVYLAFVLGTAAVGVDIPAAARSGAAFSASSLNLNGGIVCACARAPAGTDE